MEKRPVFIIAVCYIIGILLGLYLDINMALFVVFMAVIGMLVSIWMKKNIRMRFLLIACSTAVVASLIITQYNEYRFRTLYDGIGNCVGFIGTVVSIERESEYYNKYVVDVKEIVGRNKKEYNNTKVLLQIKKSKNFNDSFLEYGDLISGVGDFEKPNGRRNYKGYNYSEYLKTKGVYCICSSNVDEVCVIKKNAVFVTDMCINGIRNKLMCNIEHVLPTDVTGIAKAFLLGDSSVIGENQREVFSNACLIHVLAISGMHVSYVIVGFSFILKKIDRRRSLYIIIVVLMLFAILTGGSPSVVRAVIMGSMVLSSKLLYRKSDTISNLGIACLGVLLINPYYILNTGFQLSFLGTLGIVLFNEKITSFFDNFSYFVSFRLNRFIINEWARKILYNIKRIVVVSISANVLILPILIYNYNMVSMVFIISSICVAPILGIMSISGYATLLISLISMWFAQKIAIFLCICIRCFVCIADFCSGISFMRFMVVTPDIVIIIAYYCMIFCLLYVQNTGCMRTFFIRNSKKFLSAFLLVCILITLFNLVQCYNIGLRFYFIDVGQGDSSLIVTNENKKILIDGGGSEFGSYDVGRMVLLPYLLDRKIMTVDYMVFSHFDSDHCKGLFTVMENLRVKNAIISKQFEDSGNYQYFLKLASDRNVNVIYVTAR